MSEAEQAVVNFLILVYLIEVPIAAFAWLRVRKIYVQEQGWRSVLWRGLLWIFGIAVLVGLALFVPAVVALLNLPRLPLSGIGITLGVEVLLAGVIGFWILIERVRVRHPAIEPEEEGVEGHGESPETEEMEPGRLSAEGAEDRRGQEEALE